MTAVDEAPTEAPAAPSKAVRKASWTLADALAGVPLRPELARVEWAVRNGPTLDDIDLIELVAEKCRAGGVTSVGIGELETLAATLRGAS